MARIAATMRTNKSAEDCPDSFLENTSNKMAELFETNVKNITLEIHTDVQMMRNGSKECMMNIDVRHNSDMLDRPGKAPDMLDRSGKGGANEQPPKIKLAGEIAKFMDEQLCIPRDRTLVLFFDTRKCT